MNGFWTVLGQGAGLVLAPFAGAWLGALAGLWRRRREQLEDLRAAAIGAAVQMKASMYLSRPKVNNTQILVTADEVEEFERAEALRHAQELTKRQRDYRSALAALDHWVPELRPYWDKESFLENDFDEVITIVRQSKRRGSRTCP